MKIMIDNVDSFMGSNLSNYFIQHTDADIVGVVRTAGPYSDIEPSVRSRSRFQLQFAGSGDDAVAARHAYELPDTTIVVGRVPAFLHNFRSTIAISHTPVDCGVRNLVVPRVFGPRERVESGVARLIWSAIHGHAVPADSRISSAVYIKDVFDELTKFMLSDAVFRTMSAPAVSEYEILRFVTAELSGQADGQHNVPAELVTALRHTVRWYAANRWVAELE